MSRENIKIAFLLFAQTKANLQKEKYFVLKIGNIRQKNGKFASENGIAKNEAQKTAILLFGGGVGVTKAKSVF